MDGGRGDRYAQDLWALDVALMTLMTSLRWIGSQRHLVFFEEKCDDATMGMSMLDPLAHILLDLDYPHNILPFKIIPHDEMSDNRLGHFDPYCGGDRISGGS